VDRVSKGEVKRGFLQRRNPDKKLGDVARKIYDLRPSHSGTALGRWGVKKEDFSRGR